MSWDTSKSAMAIVCSVSLQVLVEAKVADDCQKFLDAIAEYDSMTRLDGWKKQLLLQVKKMLTAVAEEEENSEDKGKAGDGDETKDALEDSA